MDGNKTDETVALICAGGEVAPPPAPGGPFAFVVAADGGLGAARAMGLVPDVVIGDLDSADPADVEHAEAAGAIVERHHTDKDETDWELALRHVVAAGYEHVVIVGGGGGRIDHLLANALTLASDSYAGIELTWHVGTATIRVARRSRDVVISGTRGDLVSLLAVGGPARGVTTTGLRWGLDHDSLDAASSRGISNELTGEEAHVTIEEGAVLVIHEGRDR